MSNCIIIATYLFYVITPFYLAFEPSPLGIEQKSDVNDLSV